MKLVTSDQMRQVDSEAIDKRKIPGDQLMEKAGRGIADAILDELLIDPSQTKVAVFCGKGNNGGDGFVIARCLHRADVDVVLYFIGPPEKLPPDARLNFDRATELNITMKELVSADDLPGDLEVDLVIDAVFGTGFSGAPRGLSSELIEYINQQDAEIVAVDLPSGLNADNGQHEGTAVVADYTFTLALPKYGLYLSPGRELAGVVDVIPIGIPDDVVTGCGLKNELVTFESIADRLPFRKPDGHKGDFGKVFLLSGSTGLTGAASLTAYRSYTGSFTGGQRVYNRLVGRLSSPVITLGD